MALKTLVIIDERRHNCVTCNTSTPCRSMLAEVDKAWLVFKRLLQRVSIDPDALRVFVQILGKKQAKHKPVILKLGGESKCKWNCVHGLL